MLNVVSSKRRFLHMYTLPRQPRCITRLCNHCKFIYIFIFVPELQKGEGGITVKGQVDFAELVSLARGGWSEEGSEAVGGHQDSHYCHHRSPRADAGSKVLETSKQRMTS